MKVSVTFWDRFWAKVRVHADATRCWEWVGSKVQGYGQLAAGIPGGHPVRAHRAAWASWHGRWPEGHVAHGCGNPGCCNPFHLRDTTQRQNMRDRRRHGTLPVGEQHHAAKLTEADVRAIRRLVDGGFATQAACARSFGLSRHTVCNVVRRKTWRHVTD